MHMHGLNAWSECLLEGKCVQEKYCLTSNWCHGNDRKPTSGSLQVLGNGIEAIRHPSGTPKKKPNYQSPSGVSKTRKCPFALGGEFQERASCKIM